MPQVDSCGGEEGRCGEDYPASVPSVVVFTETKVVRQVTCLPMMPMHAIEGVGLTAILILAVAVLS